MGRFVMDKAGIEQICKSPEMQAALKSEADRICSIANKIAKTHLSKTKIKGRNGGTFAPKQFNRQPYAVHVDVLDHTAVGAVHTNSELGRYDNAKHETLQALSH